METAKNKIIVVGIGPGNPDYLLPIAKKRIAEAKILVAGKRANLEYNSFANHGQGAEKSIAVTGDIAGVMRFIAQELQHNDVTVLVSGDPGYYSLLDAIRREFPAERIEVIPGISAMQLAFAKVALPWHDATLLSFHGRVPAEEELAYQPNALLGMLTDREHDSQTIPALLLQKGWAEQTKLYICSRLSYADESIVATTLGEAQNFPAQKFCILIVQS